MLGMTWFCANLACRLNKLQLILAGVSIAVCLLLRSANIATVDLVQIGIIGHPSMTYVNIIEYFEHSIKPEKVAPFIISDRSLNMTGEDISECDSKRNASVPNSSCAISDANVARKVPDFLECSFVECVGSKKGGIRWAFASLHPSWRWFSINGVKECLIRRPILFIGDSHTRYLFHDIGIMLGQNSTELLTSFEELSARNGIILPASAAEFETQGNLSGSREVKTIPCDYFDYRTIRIGSKVVASWSFLSGSCCLGLRGPDWIRKVADSLSSLPATIYYGSSSFWDVARFYSTHDKRCIQNGDHLTKFLHRGMTIGLKAMHSFTRQVKPRPLVLYKHSWFRKLNFAVRNERKQININDIMSKIENVKIAELMPEAQPIDFDPLFRFFSEVGLGMADDNGHPLPEVMRSATMLFLNFACSSTRKT